MADDTSEAMATGASAPAVHPEYRRLFRTLDEAGVRYCLLRPAKSLPVLEKDLDILVDVEHRALASSRLTEIGYEVLRGEFLNPGKIVFVKWTADGLACLDVHLAVIVKGLEYGDARGALDRAVVRNGLRLLAPPDMAVVLLLHDALGKGLVQEKYHLYVRTHLASAKGTQTEVELESLGISELLPWNESDLARLYDDSAAVADLRSRVSRRLGRQPGTRWRLLLLRAKRLFARSSHGLSVCFLGPDGSGKSTTLEVFSSMVRDELNWPVSTYYMGPWGHYHLKRLMGLVRSRVPQTARELFAGRREALSRLGEAASPSLVRSLGYEWRRLRGTFRSEEEDLRRFQRETTWAWLAFRWVRGHARYWCYLAALFVELWWRYIKAWRAKRGGWVVIFDRYIYDCLSGHMHGLTTRYRWARSFLCVLYPRPDRIYLLEAPAEVIVARKKDLDLETAREMQAFYRALAKRWDMTVVSTEAPPTAVARTILDRDFSDFVSRRRS